MEERMWWSKVGNADEIGFLGRPHEGVGEGRGLGEWQGVWLGE